MADFDRQKATAEIVKQYKIGGRLAWMAADPDTAAQAKNIQALEEAGVIKPQADLEQIEALKTSYGEAKGAGNVRGMLEIKHQLANLGVFI